MQAYTNMMKTLYTTGKDYLWSSTGEKAKEPMVKVDKTATIYQAKSFHDSKPDPKKCISTLAKFIYLFNQGEPFTEAQATSLFFSITKLFQTDDPNLRRLIYTFVKQMSNQSSIYVVTSSLLKDIHHKDCNFRRNSLRTLPVVLDSSNLVQVERYIKELMNDSDPGVVSAALLSGLQMYQTNEEVVRKWGAEVTEKLKNKDQYVQYHALALIGQIKRKDTKFLQKTLEGMIKQNLTGLVGIQHLRMLKLIVQELQFDSPQVGAFIKFILKQIQSSDDNIVIEAAKIACESSFFSNKDLLEVVKILQRYLVSDSTAKKYTVLKLYNSLLKNTSRKNVVVNVKQIQKVLKDKNVNLSATAASILLRICSENYLEALLKSLSKTMSEMSIDYKIDVIKSLVSVLTTYPKQFAVINEFVFQILREEESEQLRRQAIQVLSYEITEIGGDAKKQCLKELAKFLSSAKYEKIHFQILGIISRQIRVEDVTSDLLKSLIHEIYLQEGSIRACGLSTLMKIAEIHKDKKLILQRTIAKFSKDRDQEVRERVTFRPPVEKISPFELDMIEGYLYHNCQSIQSSKDTNILGMQSIRKWGEDVGVSLIKKKKSSSKAEQQLKQSLQQQKHYKQLFQNHSTFKTYGPLRKINEKVSISDPDGDLLVWARIFLFDSNLVIMYEIENKFQGKVLENVKFEVKHSGEEFQTLHVIPAKCIVIGGKGESYVGLGRADESQYMLAEESIASIVKFVAKEYAGDTLKVTYEDEISLENLQIKLSAYISSWQMQSSDFDPQWKKMSTQISEQAYKLTYASKPVAIQQIRKKFGMTCILNEQTKNSMSSISLAGKYLGTYKTLVNIVIGFDTKNGCFAKARARSEKDGLADELLESLA